VRDIGHARCGIQNVQRIKNDEGKDGESEQNISRQFLGNGEDEDATDRAAKGGQDFPGQQWIVDPTVKDRSGNLKQRQPKTVQIGQSKVANIGAQSRNVLGIRISILFGIGEKERRREMSR
jgi:hypothetical protein